MTEPVNDSAEISQWLPRLREGDLSARQELLQSARTRLVRPINLGSLLPMRFSLRTIFGRLGTDSRFNGQFEFETSEHRNRCESGLSTSEFLRAAIRFTYDS